MVTEMLYIFNVQSNEINSWNAKHRKPIWFPGEHKHAGRNENFGPVSRPQKKKKKNPRVFSGNKHELCRPRKQSNRSFQNRENEIASEEERPAEEKRYPRFVAAR
jgi:hypothetical protein